MHSIRATADAAPDAAAASWPERLRVAARASLAAVAAWSLCLLLPGEAQPYPAAIAALLTVHPTVYQSVTVGMQYGAGVVLGALIALPVLIFVGPTWVGLAVVSLLAMLAAGYSRLGHRGVHVPATAVFVLLIGRGHLGDEATPHLVAAGVGVAIGLLCNVLFPPLQLRPAGDALDRLRRELARVLTGLGTAVAEERHPQDVLGREWREGLTGALREAHTAVDRAHESLRWNPRAGRRRRTGREVWDVDREVLETLLRVADDAGALGRAIEKSRGERRAAGRRPDSRCPAPDRATAAAPDPHFRHRYARLLQGAALCVRGCTGGLPHPVLPATRRECERLAEAADRRSVAPRAPEHRLLMILDRTLDDLDRGAPSSYDAARKDPAGA
ncbi:FUSC family protein [Streptomyces boninensis]|uniref:FUSC family protein n=1 Tax=Streptomyces boninensis TaxID=2039455 RepID=UPI003B217D33